MRASYDRYAAGRYYPFSKFLVDRETDDGIRKLLVVVPIHEHPRLTVFTCFGHTARARDYDRNLAYHGLKRNKSKQLIAGRRVQGRPQGRQRLRRVTRVFGRWEPDVGRREMMQYGPVGARAADGLHSRVGDWPNGSSNR